MRHQELQSNTRLRLTQRFRRDVLVHRMDWLYEHVALAEAGRFRKR